MTQDDVVRVVGVHLSAFQGFFLSFLGPRFLRIFYGEAVALGEIALVAERNAEVIGFVMGSASPGGFYRSLIRRRLFRFALAAAPAVLRRPDVALRVARALAKPGEAARPLGTATLMSLGVTGAVQGRGAGRALIEAFVSEAGRRGATRVDLTTDRDRNEKANAVYQRMGFRVDREITTPEGRVLNEYVIDVGAPSR